MERKARLPPLFWNKNAPKAPDGGVSRVGYQLVRMRSPFPSLKDMETGTAPTRTLSNTSASNTAQKRETGGRNPAPCFFMPFNAFRPPASSPCPAGHTSDAIPTGPALRACQPIGGGLHGAEPTFGPALCQRTDNRPGPTRGGQPIPRTPASPL
jgi:hypothetical protein